MKKSVFLAAVCVLVFSSVASAQTNPCQSSPTTIQVFQPGATPTIYVEDNELGMNDPSGQPLLSAIEIGIFLQGVNPATGQPISTISITRAQFTAVTGFPMCYRGQSSTLLATPVATFTQYFGAARGVNLAGNARSGWTAGNPFWLAGAPNAPANIRVVQ